MTVIIGNASIDENGSSHGGKAGDQTGREVLVKNWYLHKKGWRIIRNTDPLMLDRIATAMERACENPHIGYDQWQRDTLLAASAPYGYDPAQVTTDVECDCSSLVRVCIAYAYGSDRVKEWANGARFSTANMCSILLRSGDFIELPAAQAKSDKYLVRGDILVTKTQGHTVVVLSDGVEPQPQPTPTPSPCPYAVPTVTVRRGMRGEDVLWVQWHLLRWDSGCLPRYGQDGIFGAETDTAVRAYQDANGLVVDGLVGRKTRAKMLELESDAV